ncbi:hypothetical protein K431DRAFT_347045 [Polychaeton citri CBS 116435]|uniref:Uncharacterized protein n=1 Tax=Polychaeton citri CBS 116435 TaxID=1314669 RepID=A0A9P4Q8Z5_9PEZI|nr:hypothetical protein K431DRAFT_347045 [Polychaeton citri CBS 116435]
MDPRYHIMMQMMQGTPIPGGVMMDPGMMPLFGCGPGGMVLELDDFQGLGSADFQDSRSAMGIGMFGGAGPMGFMPDMHPMLMQQAQSIGVPPSQFGMPRAALQRAIARQLMMGPVGDDPRAIMGGGDPMSRGIVAGCPPRGPGGIGDMSGPPGMPEMRDTGGNTMRRRNSMGGTGGGRTERDPMGTKGGPMGQMRPLESMYADSAGHMVGGPGQMGAMTPGFGAGPLRGGVGPGGGSGSMGGGRRRRGSMSGGSMDQMGLMRSIRSMGSTGSPPDGCQPM